jgi:penicillin amidase
LSTPEKETIHDVLKVSYLATLDSIDRWKDDHPGTEPYWYQFKNTRLMHYTNQMPFSRMQVPIGGNEHIVNANTPVHGPSWRLIVEMGDRIQAYGIYPGGQSGNPGSPAYDSFVDDWAAGKYFGINFWQNPDERRKDIKTYRFNQSSGQ